MGGDLLGAPALRRRRRRRRLAVVVRETERLPEEACELAGREESPDCPARTSALRGNT